MKRAIVLAILLVILTSINSVIASLHTSDKIYKKYLTNLKNCCNMLINRKSISNPLEEYNTKIRKPFVLTLVAPIKKLN